MLLVPVHVVARAAVKATGFSKVLEPPTFCCPASGMEKVINFTKNATLYQEGFNLPACTKLSLCATAHFFFLTDQFGLPAP